MGRAVGGIFFIAVFWDLFSAIGQRLHHPWHLRLTDPVTLWRFVIIVVAALMLVGLLRNVFRLVRSGIGGSLSLIFGIVRFFGDIFSLRLTKVEREKRRAALREERVLQLERLRERNGYKEGWLYYRCKEEGLLTELYSLRKSGVLLSENHWGESYESAKPEPELKAGSFDPYKILNVARSASKGEIKRAFRELLKAYHPDVIAHVGPQWEAIANEKTKEIKRACDMLCGNE